MIRMGAYKADPNQGWTGMIKPDDLDRAAVRKIAKRFGVAVAYVEHVICAYQNASLDNANARARKQEAK